jgi:hypothetical protein
MLASRSTLVRPVRRAGRTGARSVFQLVRCSENRNHYVVEAFSFKVVLKTLEDFGGVLVGDKSEVEPCARLGYEDRLHSWSAIATMNAGDVCRRRKRDAFAIWSTCDVVESRPEAERRPGVLFHRVALLGNRLPLRLGRWPNSFTEPRNEDLVVAVPQARESVDQSPRRTWGRLQQTQSERHCP